MAACAACGHENADDARFCSSCGAALGVRLSGDVRKVVTVLFCDLAGYTSAGDALDPEALRSLQSRYFEDARAALERHGGTVEKFIGDAVMAVFGTPVLHEDDALRALRAAVELRDAVDALGFQARIGVNTGEVVAGSGDALVTGDAVNVAARLEQAAEAGEILLGEATLALARDAVEVESVEPLSAKGKPEPVPAYRLLRVLEGVPAFERRLDSPLVGRREELEAALGLFAEAVAERRGRLLTIFGPPGIGKSRLAREIASTLRGEADVLVGRCLPYGEGITYWPFVEIFRELGAERQLTDILSAPSPEDVAWAMRKLFEERARARPQVLVLEDIQWAEQTMLDLVEHLEEWTRDAPVLLVCLARPELLDDRARWGGVHLSLEPLSLGEMDALIAGLAGAAVDDDTRTRIEATSEGNPLYLEQLVATLEEGGDVGAIPPTMQALISSRLDGVPDEQLDLLERASVIGLEFEWDALAALDLDGRRPSGAELSALARKELVRSHEAIADTFVFHHILLRDAAYERIPKARRADLHERFAGWLEGRGDEFEEIIGYHLEQAHGCLAELGAPGGHARALAARAAEHLGAAGRRAAARADTAATAVLLRRATALLGETDLQRVRLLPVLGQALLDQGEWDEARAVLTEAQRMGKAIDDRVAAAEASVSLAWYRLHAVPSAEHADAQEDIEASIEVFERAGDAAGLARALDLAASIRHWSGDSITAMEEYERAARYAKEAGDSAQEAECLRGRLTVAAWGPVDATTCRALVEDLRQRARGNLRAELSCAQALAEVEAMQGDFAMARARISEAAALAAELGGVARTAFVGYAAGIVELLALDPAAAERAVAPGCRELERIGDWGHLATVAPLLGDALYLQERPEEAERWIGLVSSHVIDDDMDASIAVRRVRAKLVAQQGDVVEGERIACEAVALAERTDFLNAHAYALSDLAEVLRVAGRPKEAAAALERAIELYGRKGNVVAARNTWAAMDALSAQPPATA